MSTNVDNLKATGRVNFRRADAVDLPTGSSAAVDRNNIVLQTPTVAIPLQLWRKASDYQHLPTTAGGDFAISAGTFGTDQPIIVSQSNSGGTATDNMRTIVQMPPEYEEGNNITLRISARMTQTLATSADIDAEAHEIDRTGGVGSALISESAQSINGNTSFADLDFTIDGANLVRGDMLDIQVTASLDDSGGSNSGNAEIAATELLMDVRG